MKILLSISLLLFLCLPSYGQEDSVSSHLNIGITVSTGLSMFIGSVPKDLNNLPCPAFSVGLLDIIPTGNEDISILAGLTYDMRAFLLKDTFNGQRQTIRLHYLSIPAGFKWQRFFMAASVGISIRNRQIIEPNSFFYTTEQSPDPLIIVSTENIDLGKIFLELRAGTLIPVLYNGKNHLDVLVQGAVSTFSGDGFTTISTLNPGYRIEGPNYIASVLIGATYFFSF